VLAGRTARKPRAATPRLAACLVAILTDESMLNGGETKEESDSLGRKYSQKKESDEGSSEEKSMFTLDLIARRLSVLQLLRPEPRSG
jgi:hypothetical protein